jgi:hypothetical protein
MHARTRLPSLRRLALAALTLLLALAAGHTAFTGASMTDVTRSGAALSAGTLQLTVANAGQPLLSASGLAPGRSASGSATLSSTGDMPATAVLHATGIADTPASPALSSVLAATVADRASGTQLWSGTLASLANGASLGTLQPGAARTFDVTLAWPSGSRDPGLQGASTSFRLTWRAEAGFTASAANPQTVTAAADFVAPSASAATIQKSQGGVPGFVRPGGGYRVYANAADSGNPASGIASTTADASALTSGARAAALAAGSFTIGGHAYNRATTALTADAGLASGPATLGFAFADAAGNSATQQVSGATVDGTAPQALDVQAANGGSQAGVVEAGDSLTYVYSEPIDPISLIAGWDGTATAVTATVANLPVADAVTVSVGGAAVPLGTVTLNSKYVSATATFNATLRVEGSDVVLVLGTMTAGKTRVGTTATMSWTPATGAFDRAGNAALATAASESGTFDKDF